MVTVVLSSLGVSRRASPGWGETPSPGRTDQDVEMREVGAQEQAAWAEQEEMSAGSPRDRSGTEEA